MESTALGATATHVGQPACGHSFGAAHYCTYINVTGLQAHLGEGGHAPDHAGLLLAGSVAMAALSFQVQVRELDGLLRLTTTGTALSAGELVEAGKRLRRCAFLVGLVRDQLAIVRPVVGAAGPHRTEVACVRSLCDRAAQLGRSLDGTDSTARAPGGLRANLGSLVAEYTRTLGQVAIDVEQLEAAFPTLGWDSADLIALCDRSLGTYHPSAASDPVASTDEAVFIVAHQLFEVLFPSCIQGLREAIGAIRHGEDLDGAVQLLRRVSEQLDLFGFLIRVPMTMRAVEYLRFRPELAGGSGAESEGFRSLELLIGLRDKQYLAAARKSALFTTGHRAMLSEPTLTDAVTELLQRRGVDGRLAEVLTDPHRFGAWDVVALTEVVLDIEDGLTRWRHNHLVMVTRMIGVQPTLGVGTTGVEQPGTVADEAASGGLAYLRRTIAYPTCFPELRHAVGASPAHPAGCPVAQ